MRRPLASIASVAEFATVVGACGGVPTKDNPTGVGSAAKTATVQVEAPSNLCWSGSIGNSTKEGCGNASVDIEGLSGIVVANAQKSPYLGQAGMPTDFSKVSSLKEATTEPLTLILMIDGKEVSRDTTTAQYGVVQVSNGK